MESTWKYLDNQFIVNTNTNFLRALKLSNYHDAALLMAQNNNPLFIPIYNRYHPLHLNFVQKYNDWKSAGGSQEGETLNVSQQLTIAYAKIDAWDVAIQVVYPKSTPRYKSIFPGGRKPFNQSGITSRVNAYQTLSQNIGADPALLTVKTDVDATYLILDTARDQQEGAKASTKFDSAGVDNARIAIMDMQYRDMAFILDSFYVEREAICNALFDLPTLRDLQQNTFTGTLALSENKAIVARTFVADDDLSLEVSTDVVEPAFAVSFYLATTPNGTDSTAIQVSVNAGKLHIKASAFGISDYGTHRHLTAVNNSGVVVQFEVDLG